MIAPNKVVFKTEPQRSVIEALLKRVAKKPPSGWW
jgi:DNA/RNA-binding domain of Phe-tRNA-synthetase-like protein